MQTMTTHMTASAAGGLTQLRHADASCRLRIAAPLQTRAPVVNTAWKRKTHTCAKFGWGGNSKPATAPRSTVIPAPSYNIPAVLLGVAGLSAYSGNGGLAAATGVLGGFLAFQASRVKFKFGPEDLEVVIGEEETKEENAFVGGENRWSYDTFVNWEFWWPNFPVLVYFKETQTKPEGQIHFFPIIFDGKQVYNTMVERCGASQNSAPK